MEETREYSPAVIRLTQRKQQLTELIKELNQVLEAVEIDLQAEKLQAQADSYGGVPMRRKIDIQKE